VISYYNDNFNTDNSLNQITMDGENVVFEHWLSNEIHSVLRSREINLPKYKGASPQLCFRRFLVDKLAMISESLKLTHGILHLAVSYLDYVMDRFEFAKSKQLQLLAVCCLWVAAKLDEKDNIIPRLETLKKFSDTDYDQDDFLEMELLIMQSLDWRLLLPTTVQFLDHYLEHVIGEDDLHGGYKITAKDKAKQYIKKYACYFLEVALQEHSFNSFRPSLITSSSLASSRQCMSITPIWPDHLVEVTGYEFSHLEDCIDKLMCIHKDDEQRSNVKEP